MTKILELRVQVPVDDDVSISDLKASVLVRVRALGVEAVSKNAPDQAVVPGIEYGRAFFVAADVKQGSGTREAPARVRKPALVPAAAFEINRG
jgi:hypothetical protein